ARESDRRNVPSPPHRSSAATWPGPTLPLYSALLRQRNSGMPEVAVSRSRLGRVMRRAAGLSPRQWGLLSMMVASLVAGAVAAGVLLGRPGASAAIPVAGPPLDHPALSRAVPP